MLFFPALAQFLRDSFNQHAWIILFFAPLVEMTGIPLPLPSDTFIFLVGTRQPIIIQDAILAIVIPMGGSLLGASFLFFLMHHGGQRLVERFGKYVFLAPKRLQRMEETFLKHGHLTIIAGWCLPGLRIPTVLIASLSGMKYRDFLPFAAGGAFLWANLYFWLGVLIGSSDEDIVVKVRDTASQYGPLILAGLLVVGIIFLSIRLRTALQKAHFRMYMQRKEVATKARSD